MEDSLDSIYAQELEDLLKEAGKVYLEGHFPSQELLDWWEKEGIQKSPKS